LDVPVGNSYQPVLRLTLQDMQMSEPLIRWRLPSVRKGTGHGRGSDNHADGA
jgi:hypothetical protein